ncbi:J domain-containing protein [uncultured Psychroserpens sp.]|uniref:J domain-containing protein n=1 Tax=uncultured Psychroserpens sp. TaxID=255436 RepID=UPI00261A27AA|nr:J domain-containing protein [uncultured Psychroserpens sp.]
MELINYYLILKIEKTADLDTIKKAFRKEIALYHPDKNSSESAKAHFDLLVEAFDILSHPEKRKAYDTLLSSKDNNKPLIIEAKAEQQYKEWKKTSKKRSNTYWDTSLTELLMLDIFLETGLFSDLLSETGDLFDGIGDSLGDIGDLFDVF